MNQRTWNIVAEDSPVIRFAAEEFARLMARMDPLATVRIDKSFDLTDDKLLFIGKDLCSSLPQTKDPIIDDAICINVKNCSGKICGRNTQTKKNPSSPREPKKEGGKKKERKKGGGAWCPLDSQCINHGPRPAIRRSLAVETVLPSLTKEGR